MFIADELTGSRCRLHVEINGPLALSLFASRGPIEGEGPMTRKRLREVQTIPKRQELDQSKVQTMAQVGIKVGVTEQVNNRWRKRTRRQAVPLIPR